MQSQKEKPKFRFAPAEALGAEQKGALNEMKEAYVFATVDSHSSEDRQMVRSYLAKPDVCIVALAGETPVGFAAARNIPHFDQLRGFAVYIVPKYRRKGLLELFIHRMRSEARKRGLGEMRLDDMMPRIFKEFNALARKKGRREGEFTAYGREGIIKARRPR